MKETELFFYKDPYKKEFTAEILDVSEEKGTWYVVLDRTCFYPEGGGQPADKGRIGDQAVLDVKKKHGIVYHFLDGEPENKEGSVRCFIDWENRFDYMQQHTGQHVISGVLFKAGFGTISVHQGESYTSIEIDQPQINIEDLKNIEEEVNFLISRNLKVLDYQVEDDDIGKLQLRREPKVSGSIRIVEIEGYDRVACGGIHTTTTGEVVFAKVLFTEKIRGHARISWVIGNRVFKDYRRKQDITLNLVDLFSAKEEEVIFHVRKLMEENKNLKKEIEGIKGELAVYEMKELISCAEKIDGISIVVKEFENKDRNFLKTLISALPDNETYAVCLVNRLDNGFQWVLSVPAERFSFLKEKVRLLSVIDGKGGGKAPLYQGMGENFGGILDFFRIFRDIVSNSAFSGEDL